MREWALLPWLLLAGVVAPAALAETVLFTGANVERMDVSKDADSAALAAKMKGQPIDILLNNASLIRSAPLNDSVGNNDPKFGTLDYELLDDYVQVNVAGPLKVVERFIDTLVASLLPGPRSKGARRGRRRLLLKSAKPPRHTPASLQGAARRDGFTSTVPA